MQQTIHLFSPKKKDGVDFFESAKILFFSENVYIQLFRSKMLRKKGRGGVSQRKDPATAGISFKQATYPNLQIIRYVTVAVQYNVIHEKL